MRSSSLKMATGGKTNMFYQNRKKSNRCRLAKQQLCTCITFFWTFLCCRCMTKTWKCLISRFVEDRTTRQGLSFSFPKTLIQSLEFNSRKICEHLTNWTSWNKRDKVWSSANKLFQWHFRCRCRRCCLSSLLANWQMGASKITRSSHAFLGHSP